MKNLGQLFITGIQGLNLFEEEKNFIQENEIGGVILFDRNYESLAQVGELINSIQELKKEYPLFIALDYEGGRVQRFKKGLTPVPAMAEVAKGGSPKLCFELCQAMANEIKHIGINLNLAPCCDIFSQKGNKVIGDRAFGKSEEIVSQYVTSAIRGFQTQGIIACAKHFPGHGPTNKDSHFELPIIKKLVSEIIKEDIQPFDKAIKSRVEMVMMGHLQIDDIDEKLPTSLSPNAHKLLREDLKFRGVIISDDMDMKAITDNYGLGKATLMALDAGTDIVEFSKFDSTIESFNFMKSQKLDADVYKEKIARVLKLKEQYLKNTSPVSIPEIGKQIGLENFQNILSEINKNLS